MSKEAVLSFIEAVNANSALKARVDALPGDVPALTGAAEAAGFRFTEQEWGLAIAELAAQASGELSDGDLAKVVGGLGLSSPTGLLPNAQWIGKFACATTAILAMDSFTR